MRTRSRFPRARMALLLVDVINPFDFEGGANFARRAQRVARVIERLRALFDARILGAAALRLSART